jgi:hypothetical protein
MNRFAGILCVGALMAGLTFAAGKGPEIQIIDGKISMQAEAVPLARLLRLLDSATGMTSKVPPELANRNVSVRFSGLPFDAAVRKIFEGQSLDYVVIGGKGVIVTAVAQSTPGGAQAGPSPFGEQPGFPQQSFAQDQDQPTFQLNPQPVPGQGQVVTQTPFGPMPIQQQPQPQPAAPGFPGAVVPGPSQNGVTVGSPFGTLNPFSSNPFGNPAGNANPAPAQTNPLFGNTAPSPFQQNTPTPPPK